MLINKSNKLRTSQVQWCKIFERSSVKFTSYNRNITVISAKSDNAVKPNESNFISIEFLVLRHLIYIGGKSSMKIVRSKFIWNSEIPPHRFVGFTSLCENLYRKGTTEWYRRRWYAQIDLWTYSYFIYHCRLIYVVYFSKAPNQHQQ